MTKKVLIIGGSGMLGTSLLNYLQGINEYYILFSQSFSKGGKYRGDFRDVNESSSFLDEIKPDIIINLAALTNVDKCEINQNDAYLLNVKIVENITFWLKNNKFSKLLHISTDHIYDSLSLNSENDVVIKNSYALSKYAGELACDLERTIILRTNFIGRSLLESRKSFSDWLITSLNNNDEISVLKDVYFSPLEINDLCKYIHLSMLNIDTTGIYNLGSCDSINKADFCLSIGRKLGFSCENIKVIEAKDAAFLKTTRPTGMGMNCEKFMKSFNTKLPTISETIEKVIEAYK